MADSQSDTPTGFIGPSDTWGLYANLSFLMKKSLEKMQTATLVKVVAVSNSGGVDPVGTVDVVPMVDQIDSNGESIPHTTIFNVPYCRLQGGANAIIIDPQVGDIGIAVFASRDISKVKSTKSASPPDSRRVYSFSDALYIGGVLNGAPEQYIQFSASGIAIFSPTNTTVTAPVVGVNASTSTTVTTPTMTVNGNIVINGDLTTTGQIAADGVVLNTHTHGGVQPGGGNRGGPN